MILFHILSPILDHELMLDNFLITSSVKGAYYIDRRGWVGGQSNVYTYKVNDLFLLTSFVYKGWVGVQKSPKTYPRSY